MFAFRHGALHAESVPLDAVAREFGTPCYVYSRAALAAALRQFQSACGERERPEALFALEHILR